MTPPFSKGGGFLQCIPIIRRENGMLLTPKVQFLIVDYLCTKFYIVKYEINSWTYCDTEEEVNSTGRYSDR